MNINATVFVQVIHFLFVYLLLRYFLLRPVANLILAERAYRKKLKDVIEHEGHILVHKEEQQKKKWFMFQKEWQEQIPSLQQYVKKTYQELDIKKILLSQNMLEQEAQKVAKHIKERVDYAK